MKLSLFLIAVLGALGTCFAQDIPKKAEAITITTTMPDSTLFGAVSDALDKEGYTVSRSDNKRGSITTDHRALKTAWTMRILANVAQGVVTLRSQWSASLGGTTSVNNPSSNTPGLMHGSDRASFAELNKLASKIAQDINGTVGYLPAKTNF